MAPPSTEEVSRDVLTALQYFNPNAPRTGDGAAVEFSPPQYGMNSGYRPWGYSERRGAADTVLESHAMTVHDARTTLPGGLDAWDFDEHGFAFVAAPEPVQDFGDPDLMEA